MYWMRRNLSSEFVIYFRKSFSAPWGTATETVPTWTYISKDIFLFCLTAPKGHGTIPLPPPPPPPPWGGEGGRGYSRKRAKYPDLRKKKSLLSEGFVLTISVGDQNRFRRRDEFPARVDQIVKRIAAKRRGFHLGRREQRGKEVLLLA